MKQKNDFVCLYWARFFINWWQLQDCSYHMFMIHESWIQKTYFLSLWYNHDPVMTFNNIPMAKRNGKQVCCHGIELFDHLVAMRRMSLQFWFEFDLLKFIFGETESSQTTKNTYCYVFKDFFSQLALHRWLYISINKHRDLVNQPSLIKPTKPTFDDLHSFDHSQKAPVLANLRHRTL